MLDAIVSGVLHTYVRHDALQKGLVDLLSLGERRGTEEDVLESGCTTSQLFRPTCWRNFPGVGQKTMGLSTSYPAKSAPKRLLVFGGV